MDAAQPERDFNFADDEGADLEAPPEEVMADEEEKASREPDTDYYSLLNVAKDASAEDIKASYRRLSMLLHPDKHQSPEDKATAERKITVLNEAYEDPNKRAVYDQCGCEGLDAMKNMQVGQRLKTPAEIRAEYERHRLKLKRLEVENMMRTSHTKIQLSMDATTWLDPDARHLKQHPAFAGLRSQTKPKGLAELLTPEISGLQLAHTTQVEITPNDTVSLSGVIVSKHTRGGGYIVTSYHRKFVDGLWAQADMALGSNTFITLKAGGQLNTFTYYNVQANFLTWPWNQPPALECTIGRALGLHTSGHVTYRTGEWSLSSEGISADDDSLEVGFQRSTQKRQKWRMSVQAGVRTSSIEAKYTHPITKAAAVHCSSSLSTTEGFMVGAGAERSVFSQHNTVGASLECSSLIGVTFKLRFSRLGQTLSIPILLSDSAKASVVLYATTIPLTFGYAVKKLFTDRYFARLEQSKMERLKLRAQERMEEKRREAQETIQLMQAAYFKKKEQEETSQGLVILEAFYGHNPSQSNTMSASELVVDVTIPLQMLVQQSQLHLAGDRSKASLLGFYDPCPWIKNKQLYIRYRYRGRLHEVRVHDSDALSCPLRTHLLQE